MTNTPTTPKPKTAQPPQFSLLTLMLWVTVVGLYFGGARWVGTRWVQDVIFSHDSTIIPQILLFFILEIIVFGLNMLWIPQKKFSLIYWLCGVFALLLTIGRISSYPRSETDVAVAVQLSWCSFFFFSIAAISSIRHCKKVTGSWFPFVGKRPEGESNE